MAQQCGAKTRSGAPCKRSPVPGGKRCKLHGGKSHGAPHGNKNAASPGSLYSQFLTPEEEAFSVKTKLDSIDDEIRLQSALLARALAAWQASNDDPELDEITERDVNENVGARREERFKRRDYPAIVDRITGRLESLKFKRAAMIAGRADSAIKRNADRRADELHSLEVAAKQKAAQITNGHVTNNIMPVPTADSVDGWEEVASQQQDKALGQ